MEETADCLDDMQDIVARIVRALVDSPEEVEVSARTEEKITALTVRVGREDTGKVIGKQGRIVRSIRTILGAVSVKHRHRYALEILDNQDGPSAP